MSALLATGLNYKIAPLEVRERLAFGPERVLTVLHNLQAANGSSPEQFALLSTCNRTEVYTVAHRPEQTEDAVRACLKQYARRDGVIGAEITPYLYSLRGEQAARHLLRVACGLDSLVKGENEILGQVRKAGELAQAAGTSGATLTALFRYAVQAGKRARRETELGVARRSVATLVVELAQETLGSLEERTALLIGAGKISAMTARALVQAGLHCVLVTNRTFERARRLAQNLGGGVSARAVRFDALSENLAQADLIICSTGAPHIVLHLETVQAARSMKRPRPMLVADLAVPRDVDPAIAALPGVRLVDIDNLEALVEKRHPLAAAVCRQAEEIVSQELDKFLAWQAAREAVPLIQALQCRAQEICLEQTQHTLRRLGGLTPEQQGAVEAMGQAIAGKLLHEPIVHLKEPPLDTDLDQYKAWAEWLFGLEIPKPG
jgi:glutamyl-tRNA reductase